MKIKAITTTSVQIDQTRFIEEMQKNHLHQVETLDGEVKVLRAALQESKGKENAVTIQLQELKLLHATTTDR